MCPRKFNLGLSFKDTKQSALFGVSFSEFFTLKALSRWHQPSSLCLFKIPLGFKLVPVLCLKEQVIAASGSKERQAKRIRTIVEPDKPPSPPAAIVPATLRSRLKLSVTIVTFNFGLLQANLEGHGVSLTSTTSSRYVVDVLISFLGQFWIKGIGAPEGGPVYYPSTGPRCGPLTTSH